MKPTLLALALLPMLSFISTLRAQEEISPYVGETFWEIEDRRAIVWDVAAEKRLPHKDHIEMGGRKVAAIIDYAVGENRQLSVDRTVIYPQLRAFLDQTGPEWAVYRAYLRETYSDEILPVLLVDRKRYRPSPLEQVKIDGTLRFLHETIDGVQVERRFLPSMQDRLLAEVWTVTNRSSESKAIQALPAEFERVQMGPEGEYRLRSRVRTEVAESVVPPGETFQFALYFEASMAGESPVDTPVQEVVAQREDFVDHMADSLVLRSPDPVIDTLYLFSKIRASESIYDSKLGLVHSPGGGNYYVGVWANDQAEYSGPFFPYLGYENGAKAALNAYLAFLDNMPEGDGRIFSSFEMQGELACCSKDRGDAAMIAYGATHYAMATGDESIARMIWPLIEWALEYSKGRVDERGVLRSETDEMEGRIPTGDANLAASALYYGGLKQAASLARALGLEEALAADYEARARSLAGAIERHFGARVAGLETYRYYEGHEALRHWISLPLVVGLHDRKEDTLAALFERMWTPNGVRVEWSPDRPEMNLFWDRGTLYALQGAFLAGAADVALDRWQEYSRTRLLGFHVPYVIEAWPENDMRHLSAESALYARIATEGLLGIDPTGFSSFEMKPRLPQEWREGGYRLSAMHIQGRVIDVVVEAAPDGGIAVKLIESGRSFLREVVADGESLEVQLPQ